ncbi:hypothetical protein J7L87_02005 [bacterium]|nr:hypothetical protein [bacterium]
MLENLKRTIHDKVKENKEEHQEYVSRTIQVFFSFNVDSLKNKYYELFPSKDKEVEIFYPWVDWEKESTSLEEKIINIFSSETLTKFTDKGYKILDHSNQLIVVSDLTKHNIEKKINSFQQFFSHILDRIGNPTLYKIGIFILRNLNKSYTDRKESAKLFNIADFNWIKFFDKVFFFDISNPEGVIIEKEENFYSLIIYLIRYLRTKPIQFVENEKVMEFGSWVKTIGVSEHKCCSFSGFTLSLPIEYILETVLVMKGGEIIEKSFIGKFSEDKVSFYSNSFINEFPMLSPEVLIKHMKNRIKTINPICFENLPLPYEEPDKVKLLTKFFVDLETKLPEYAEVNKKILKSYIDKFVSDFRYKLNDYLNHILKAEKGGVLLAIEFLKQIYSVLENYKIEEPAKSIEVNIEDKISQLERECENGPRKNSLIARTFTAFLPLVLIFLNLKSFKTRLIPTFLSLLLVGSSYIYWDTWVSRVLRIFQEIKKLIEKKWENLMKKVEYEILKDLCVKLKEVVEELRRGMERTKLRVEEIVDFCKRKYLPSPLPGYGFLSYAVDIPSSKEQSDAEIREFEKYINFDIEKVAEDFVVSESPLEFWQRLSSPEQESFNRWEYTLIEKASLKALPYAGRLVNLSICEVLRNKPERKEKVLALLQKVSFPYIILKPGSFIGELRALLEFPSKECKEVSDKFSTCLSRYFTLEKRETSPLYRISLYVIQEEINIDDIKWIGG